MGVAGGTADLLEGIHGICYLTDRDDVVVALGRRHWNAFAEKNDGADLVDGTRVIGRPIFDFISGNAVLERWRRAFAAIKDGKRSFVQVLTRCDSPSVRRELVVTLTPVRDGRRIANILVQSLAVSEQQRPNIGLFDFRQLNANAAAPILAMCSYCQSVRYPLGSKEAEGEWITAEEYYRRGGASQVRISHGICEPCAARAEASLAA